MKRACAVKAAGQWDGAKATDSIMLDAHERHRRRAVLNGERGTTFMLDLPQKVMLCDGDGLVLDDGSLVRVIARAEPLVEITVSSAHDLARLAWHIGNRHVDIQIVRERLRIRRDHVVEDMLAGLGAHLSVIEAPFEPERGAYQQRQHAAHGHHHDEREHG